MNASLPSPQLLLALNRAVTTTHLLASAIHEVNNSLQTISGSLELLQRREEIAGQIAPALDRMRRQSARATTVLAELTAFNKANVEDRGTVSLKSIARQAVDLRTYAVARARLTMELAAGDDECMVHGNRAHLEQAILNLLLNAEKALAGTQGQIRVDLDRGDNHVRLRVTDNGAGIAIPAEQLCEPFASAHSPAQTQAPGLGLWAARAIAEAHGGSLTIDSGPTGTTASLRLPQATPSAR